MKKNMLCVLLVLVPCIALSALGGKEAPQNGNAAKSGGAHYPVTIKNYDWGGAATEYTFAKAPERVITCWQNSVENMIALGLGDKIVLAVGIAADEIKPEYRAAFSAIPKTQKNFVDKESALGLRPDFILGWYSSFAEKSLGSVRFWHERNIGTYIANNSGVPVVQQSLEMEYADILALGKIFNVEAKAEALVRQMRDRVQAGRDFAKGKKPVDIIILEDERGKFRIYGENCIGGDIAKQLGANLLAKDKSVRKSAEDIIALNPEMIFGVHFGPNSKSLNDKNCMDVFKANPAFLNIAAVKNNKLYPTDLSLVYCPGVRVIDSINFFLERLYPGLNAK